MDMFQEQKEGHMLARRLKTLCSTLYFRLMLVMVAVLLPLLFTTILMYQWGRSAVWNELTSSAASHAQYLRDHFQNTVQSATIQLEYTMNASPVTDFFLTAQTTRENDNVSYYTHARNVIQTLQMIAKSNYYIEDLSLYYLPLDVSLSSSFIMKQEANSYAYELLQACQEKYQTNLLYLDGAYSVVLTRPSTLRSGMPTYLAAATLDISHIQEQLANFSAYNNKNAFMLYHGSHTNIVSCLYSSEMSSEDISAIEGSSFPGLRTDTEDAYFLKLPQPLSDRYLAVACYSSQLQSTFVQLIPLENLRTIPNHFRNFILIYLSLFFLVSFAFALFLYRLVKKPVNDFRESFRSLGDGNFGISIIPSYSYEYNELAENFNKMSSRLEHLVRENFEQTIHIQAAELKQLQAQINPHFLYNSFIFISNMISTGDCRTAEEFLYHLSKYYEYLTRNTGDIVSLKEEYTHMLNYLSIQDMRFEGMFDLKIEELPESSQTIPVPRLILQPLAENIIRHGLDSGEEEAVIRISTSVRSQSLFCLSIENSGHITEEALHRIQRLLKENGQSESGIGMANINTRLKLYYHDDACGLEAARSVLGGLHVTVVIRREKL